MYVLLVACSGTQRACFSILLYLSLVAMSAPLSHDEVRLTGSRYPGCLFTSDPVGSDRSTRRGLVVVGGVLVVGRYVDCMRRL